MIQWFPQHIWHTTKSVVMSTEYYFVSITVNGLNNTIQNIILSDNRPSHRISELPERILCLGVSRNSQMSFYDKTA